MDVYKITEASDYFVKEERIKMIEKSTKHEREFYDIAFDIVYTKDENMRRVALSNLLRFILPAIRQARQELSESKNPASTTGMDMLENLDRYISKFNSEVDLYERTRGVIK
jgi:hypothetical protein